MAFDIFGQSGPDDILAVEPQFLQLLLETHPDKYGYLEHYVNAPTGARTRSWPDTSGPRHRRHPGSPRRPGGSHRGAHPATVERNRSCW